MACLRLLNFDPKIFTFWDFAEAVAVPVAVAVGVAVAVTVAHGAQMTSGNVAQKLHMACLRLLNLDHKMLTFWDFAEAQL